VFAGKVSANWKTVVEKWNLFENLNHRKAIDFETYEKASQEAIK
jgi:hydroxymethylglutaryl-CoA synthase